jgi:hypothetical protein
MAPKKPKKKSSKDDIPFQCLDCGHGAEGEWKKSKYGTKACPICGSKNTQKMEAAAETLGEPGLMDQPVAPPGTVPLPYQPPTPEPKAQPAKAAKAAPAKQTAPLATTIPKVSTSVDVNMRSPQEEQFAQLLADVGVKQADLLSRIIMQSDKAEDPKYIDAQLMRYKIPLLQRQIVIDAWSASMGIDPYMVGHGGEAQQAGGQSSMSQMVNEMREMFMLQTMAKMMGNDNQQRPAVDPATRPPAEPLVPMTDENGEIMVDPTTGQVIKVPASLYMIYKGKQNVEQPSSLDQFMSMQNYNMEQQKMFMEMFGGQNKGPDPEMMAKMAGLEAETRMRALDQERSNQIGELQAQLQIEQALKRQEAQFGQYISEKDKQIKTLASELEMMRQSREVSYQETQVDMARKTNDVVMDTVKEATKEMREARKDIRGIMVENMRNEQFVQAATERVSGGPVMEVPLDQVEADVGNMAPGQDQMWDDVMLGEQVTVDYNLLEPDEENDGY